MSLDRRALICGLGGAIASCSLRAETRMLGAMKQVYVEKPARITQECPQWCWAASAAMIFQMNGHPMDQKVLIQRVFGGGMACVPASGLVMSKLLSDEWTDRNATKFRSKLVAAYDIQAGIIAIDNNFIVNELAENRPLLYANKHHAMAVVSATYYETPYGPNVQSVGVLDPWPWSAAYHFLTPIEMLAAHKGGDYMYLAGVHTA